MTQTTTYPNPARQMPKQDPRAGADQMGLFSAYCEYLRNNGIAYAPIYKHNAPNAFVMSFEQYKIAEANKPETRLAEVNNQLDHINDMWYAAELRGEDSDDPTTDAYHLKRNAKRLVSLIDKMEA